MVLEIAGFSDQFSIVKFFITQSDVKMLLDQPSLQVVKTFDDVLLSTRYTTQIVTLDTHEENRLLTFWSAEHKISPDQCQAFVTEELDRNEVPDNDRLMKEVRVRILELDWLQREVDGEKKDFLDLVTILNDQKN